MSHRHKNLERGIKQPLVDRLMPPRAERHGKPVTVRRRSVVTNPLTGLVEVHFTNATTSEPHTARVAADSTGTHGKRNVLPEKGKR